MKNIKYFILTLMSLHLFYGYCQNRLPEITMPTPNALGMGVYGEVPISYFTGIPNIEVPLYSFKEGDLRLPINLNYYASGIKPDQHPGWVGLNWSLNAGGVITRITHDLPDEYNCPNITLKRYYSSLPEVNAILGSFDSGISGINAGYYFNHSVNSTDQWSSASNIMSMVNNQDDAKDTEPDEFCFNFLGYSGKFYITDSGNWAVQCDQNITVVFEDENFIDLPSSLAVSKTKHFQANCLRRGENMKSFGGFTLITDEGVKYSFGTNTTENNTNSIEYSIPFFQQLSEQWVATSWYLTKIVSPQGKAINLTYEPDDYISNMYIYFQWSVAYYLNGNNRTIAGGYGKQYDFGQNEITADWINPRYAPYLGNLIRPTYLERIDGTNVSVHFKRSNSNELKYINDIYLKNKNLQKMIISQSIPNQICSGGDQSPEKDVYWPFLYDVVQSTKDLTLLTALKWKKLDLIEIMDKKDTTQGWQYELKFNNTEYERLNLSSISKKDFNSTINCENYYLFDYYDNPDIAIPNYLEECTDHWGFFNGNTQKCLTQLRTLDFTQNGPSNLSQYYSLREPTNNINVAIEGSLRSITYPTKGKTTFEYEQNNYSKIFDITSCDNTTQSCLQNVIANPKSGGLRIKKITTETPNGTPIVKEYLYVKSYNPKSTNTILESSGILGGKNQYVWNYYDPKVNSSTVKKIEKNIISSQSVLPLSVNSHGVQLGYSEVVEKRDDGSYSIYKYSNYDNGIHFDERPMPGSYNSLSPYTVYSSREIERGRLISTEHYDTGGRIALKDSLVYTCLSDDYIHSLYLSANTFICHNGELWTAYLGLPYKKYIYKYKITKKILYENYDSNGHNPLTTMTVCGYNKDNLLSTEKTYNIINNNANTPLVELHYKYPNDYVFPVFSSAYDKTGKIFAKMVDKNMLEAPIEVTKTIDNNIVESKLNLYIENNGHILPDKSFILEINNLMTYSYSELTNMSMSIINDILSWYFYKSPDYKSVLAFNNYDSYSNVTQYTGSDGIVTSLLWDATGTYIMAKVEGATYSHISTKAGKASNYSSKMLWSDLRETLETSAPNAMITTYSHKPLVGITEQTSVNGTTTYYSYDSFGRLAEVRDDDGKLLKKNTYNYANQ